MKRFDISYVEPESSLMRVGVTKDYNFFAVYSIKQGRRNIHAELLEGESDPGDFYTVMQFAKEFMSGGPDEMTIENSSN